MKIIANPKILDYVRPGDLGRFTLKGLNCDLLAIGENINGEKFLGLIHTPRYIRKIKRACDIRATLAEVPLTPEKYEIACLGIGTVISASETNDFAIQYLTGHHASSESARGFNIFNSIAIATQRIVNSGKKVCIIDIDGHHGNGIQDIFYKSDKVLYCSIHQSDAFPGTGKSSEMGSGAGKGYTLNIPLPANSSDDNFLSALEKIVEKAINFNPDVVAVYAGFDGYREDLLLKLNYSIEGYYKCGKLLGKNFERMFAVLGGGYHNRLVDCIQSFVSGVNDGREEHKK